MEIVRYVIYPFDPAFPLGELVQLVKYEQRIIRAPSFSKNILTVFLQLFGCRSEIRKRHIIH